MSQNDEPVTVRIETDLGGFTVALDPVHAPVTTANFLFYVDGGFYDGGRFHRAVRADNQSNAGLRDAAIGAGIDPAADRSRMPNDTVPIQVIQGGIDPARADGQRPPIPLERTRDTGLTHRDGTISMARFTPDSAVSDFFICIGDWPVLDFGGPRNPDGQGFAAVGQVTDGMDIVRAIQQSPADGQMLEPPITIRSARRV